MSEISIWVAVKQPGSITYTSMLCVWWISPPLFWLYNMCLCHVYEWMEDAQHFRHIYLTLFHHNVYQNMYQILFLVALFLLVFSTRYFLWLLSLAYGCHVEKLVGLSGCMMQPSPPPRLHHATWRVRTDIFTNHKLKRNTRHWKIHSRHDYGNILQNETR